MRDVWLTRLSICVLASCIAWSPGLVSAQPTFSEHGSTVLGGLNLNARSASLADIDNDGDLDVMFQGGFGAQQLLRNNLVGEGSFYFTNISGELPADLSVSWSAAWGDYNRDGNIDVFVGQSNTSVGASGDVLSGNGAGRFFNLSEVVGLDDPGFHQNVAWSDIDNDRDLDLIFGMEGPEKHEIYLQGSDGTFTPVGALVGFQEDTGVHGYGMAIGDTDGDGDKDIYISTCVPGGNIRNNFYKNMLVETGSLGFVDISDTNGTQFTDNSYGAEFHDFDDDGDLDLFMVGADGEPSKMFRNDGGNNFTDVDTVLGHAFLSDTAGDLNGSRAIDYDNDGDLDLYLHDHLPVNGSNQARKLYRNEGNWQFTDVTASEGLAATNEGAYDSTWGDLDLDGDLDLIAPTGSTFNERVFLSDASNNGNHWLFLELAGPADNTTGIGAEVYAKIHAGTPDERTLRREANTNAGTFNQSDVPVHLGLGNATLIDELTIVWPDGTVQQLLDISVDQYLTVVTPGDFLRDGVVDAADLALWVSEYGLSGGSDANLDGQVNGYDFLAWQRQLGNGQPGGVAAVSVPEPSSGSLLGIFGLLILPVRSFSQQRFRGEIGEIEHLV